jgi:hypothetical protein
VASHVYEVSKILPYLGKNGEKKRISKFYNLSRLTDPNSIENKKKI